ncbi:MAG: hypothetical protein LCH81_06675 [Bacteroidetes bacterium]|nr:hypothetical protein [Bacteroidota bacterium]
MAKEVKNADFAPKPTWDEEKKEFARQVFAQALIFMERDNELVGHCTVFTGTVARYIQENPDFISKLSSSGSSTVRMAKNEGGLEGADTWDDIQHIIDAFKQITDIIREDKKFFAGLLSEIFGWGE